ncbi:MAG: hypothetical protein H6907_11455 [Hyphomicrobiales bacterium]|nr:hypothetical protein [Hyphomicrobiales bacterium]MCP5372338.1 hypothetical protein [Hyphomicrobiales bacterium]
MTANPTGWDWLEPWQAAPADDAPRDAGDAGRELAGAFARCLRGRDGERVLGHLRALTRDRALGPGAPDAVLRHLEGQRQLVAHVLALVERGRQGGPEVAAADPDDTET